MVRSFIAIHLPIILIDQIYLLSERFQSISTKNSKYIEKENIHITLKFIGETSEECLKNIEKELTTVKGKAFSLNIRKIGAFPNFVFPKVLWVGIEDNKDLNCLFDSIEFITNKFGVKNDYQEFHPHITLARLKDKMGQDLMKSINGYKNTDFGPLLVNEFHLIKSELTKNGPHYTEMNSYKLM